MITGRRGGKLKIDDSLKRPARDKICRAIIRDGVIIWRKLHAMFALHRRESTGAAVNKMKLRSSCCFLTFSVLCIGCHVIARLAVLLPSKGCCAFRVATLPSNPTPSGGISFQPKKKLINAYAILKRERMKPLFYFVVACPPPPSPSDFLSKKEGSWNEIFPNTKTGATRCFLSATRTLNTTGYYI